MTNKEAIEELKKVDTLDMPARLCEAHYMAIKALEQELKADTWSIKDVADTFKKHGLIVEQEPKTGHWKKIQSGDKDFPESIVCSRCGHENSYLDFGISSVPIGKFFMKSKFCPYCGCRMVESQESEDK